MPVPTNVLAARYRPVMATDQNSSDRAPQYGSREWAEREYEYGGGFGWFHRR